MTVRGTSDELQGRAKPLLAPRTRWTYLLVVFGVVVVPSYTLLASIGDFRYTVHHILTVRGNRDQWQERTKHHFSRRVAWT